LHQEGTNGVYEERVPTVLFAPIFAKRQQRDGNSIGILTARITDIVGFSVNEDSMRPEPDWPDPPSCCRVDYTTLICRGWLIYSPSPSDDTKTDLGTPKCETLSESTYSVTPGQK